MKPITSEDTSYDDLIRSFEVQVLLEVTDNDYQGDTRLILRDGNRFGLLTFGWGSCSGCDALQQDLYQGTDAVQELRDLMWSQIHWEDSASALHDYIAQKDWALDYSYNKDFNDQALVLLGKS
jgi:hypothetical protein